MNFLPHALALLVLAPPTVAQDWTPTAEQTAVYRALSARGEAPSCAEVEALATDPLDALRAVVEHAKMPPWAAMGAAHCIIEGHAHEARADMTAWVSQEQTRGLGLLVLGKLDSLQPHLATEVATAALQGPIADDARARLADSTVPDIQALLDEQRTPGER